MIAETPKAGDPCPCGGAHAWIEQSAETVESIEAEWSPLSEPCAACNAEPGEPCRPGCLGYALDHDQL